MSDIEKLFESERPRLTAIAYRMLGTVSDAEDAVQQCFLRFRQIDPSSLLSPRGFLTTVVTRICVDELRSARARREVYPGTWLPEPIRTDGAVDVESVRMAFLVILETLSPEERAIYLLCEVFDYSHEEVSAILGKSIEACRQALHRAQQRVASRRPRFSPSREAHARIVQGFLLACQAGDLEGLRALLTEDAVASADAGGKVPAARQPVVGREAVARLLVGITRLAPKGMVVETTEMNGDPAAVLRVDGRVDTVILLEVDSELKISAVRYVRNPEKLARV